MCVVVIGEITGDFESILLNNEGCTLVGYHEFVDRYRNGNVLIKQPLSKEQCCELTRVTYTRNMMLVLLSFSAEECPDAIAFATGNPRWHVCIVDSDCSFDMGQAMITGTLHPFEECVAS